MSAIALAVAALAAAVVVPAVSAPAASAQTVADVEARDSLIADQENLLNTYRCLFGVDVDVVPGSCPDPDQVSPGVAPQSPAQQDIDVRDQLIANQEALLNTYRCRFDVDTQIVPGGCVDGAPAGPAADWYPDPTCRHDYRWWDGRQWTGSVGNQGVASPDAVLPGDTLTDPGAVRSCTPAAGGLTAAELGCVGADAPCRVGDDGLAYATRIVSHAELVASGGFHPSNKINPYTPDVADEVALGYLTDCLREWGDFAPARTERYRFTASPVQACSAVWRAAAYAVNHLGAADVDCVWGSFERLWLRGGAHQARAAHSGWAETCPSWLDPVPERDVPQWCANLDLSGYIADISRSPSWEEWGLTEYLTYDWVEDTYCTWMEKCKDAVE